MINVLIVDDHQLVRAGLRAIIEAEPDLSVIGEATDGAEALNVIAQLPVDVVLMDIQMPTGMGGIEATRNIRRLAPQVRVLTVSALSAEPLPSVLRDAGASGYLTKGCPATELVSAIRSVFDGNPYIDAGLAQDRILSTWMGTDQTPFEQLSSRELQVVMLILEGQCINDIAAKLALNTKTVSTYRRRIQDKLGVRNDVELMRVAYQHGLFSESGGS